MIEKLLILTSGHLIVQVYTTYEPIPVPIRIGLLTVTFSTRLLDLLQRSKLIWKGCGEDGGSESEGAKDVSEKLSS